MHKKYLEQALQKMQENLFEVIKTGKWNNTSYKNGQEAKTAYIRGGAFINPINNVLKKSFKEIDNNLEFKPKNDDTVGEEVIKGFMKRKKQDLTIRIKNNKNSKDYPLIINNRTQMSKISANWDTIFERAYAEALNLRSPNNYIIGEVFVLPYYEMDHKKCEENIIKYKAKSINLDWFFSHYTKVNLREDTSAEGPNFLKYDKLCILVIDFRKNPAKIVTDFGDNNLNQRYKEFSYEGFCEYLLSKYKKIINAD